MWFNSKRLVQSQAGRLASASRHCGSPHHMLYDYSFSVFTGIFTHCYTNVGSSTTRLYARGARATQSHHRGHCRAAPNTLGSGPTTFHRPMTVLVLYYKIIPPYAVLSTALRSRQTHSP